LSDLNPDALDAATAVLRRRLTHDTHREAMRGALDAYFAALADDNDAPIGEDRAHRIVLALGRDEQGDMFDTEAAEWE
jgi:hypothetical protein